jgi:hypothetical protein
MKMGLCRVITSDQGGEFNNEINKELMTLLGIDHRLATPYHPQASTRFVHICRHYYYYYDFASQANGLDERFNQTIQVMLTKFIDEKKDYWEDYLDTCIYAYNTAKHESSQFTPFELMFSRKAVLPLDLEYDKRCGEDILTEYLTEQAGIIEQAGICAFKYILV